jgi:hypothetical protein
VAGNVSRINDKIRVLLIAVLLTGSITGSLAQQEAGYSSIHRIMSRIPDSLTYTAQDIADYVDSKFSTQREKSRAIFLWISRNIAYNFDSLFTNRYDESASEISERILKTRIGVCLNYATLFNEISNRAGIRSYVVQGYTKQGGRVHYLPHIWCAGFIDSVWYLTDPTWGAGYVYKGEFINQINSSYLMAKPEVMIRSHMPFDPVWQLLNHPVTHREFYKGNFRDAKNRLYFSFPDSLHAYEHASELDRAVSSARRIEQCGVMNSFIEAKLRVLQGDIVFLKNRIAAEKYELAVIKYNTGINMLNRFIGYRNNRFQPEEDSAQYVQLLDSTEYLFTVAIQTLAGINGPDENLVNSVNSLTDAIGETLIALHEQRFSLKNYLKDR